MGPFEIFMAIVGVISVIMSAVSAANTNEQNAELARENREDQQEYNTQAAAIANQNTINQYNLLQSPSAKVRQYKSAGLNPALIYGIGGGTVGSSAQAAPSTQAAPLMNPILGNNMDSIMNMMTSMRESVKSGEDTEKTKTETDLLKEDIKKTRADTKLIEEKTNTEIVSRNGMELDNKLKEYEVTFAGATLEKKIETTKEMLEEIKLNNEKTRKEIAEKDIDLKWKDKLYEQQEKLMHQQTQLIIKQQATEVAKEALLKAQELLANAQTEEAKKKAEALVEQAKLYAAQVEELGKKGYMEEQLGNKAKKETDYYEVNKTADLMGQILQFIGKIIL